MQRLVPLVFFQFRVEPFHGDDGNPASGFTLEMDLRVDITVDGQGSISRVWTRRLASGAQTQISASGGLVVIRPGGRLATARRWVADLVA